MATVERVEAAFLILHGEYEFRKRQTEDAVVVWEWATSPWFDPRPLYFERHGWPRGRRLKKAPLNPVNRTLCGLDRQGRVVVQREGNEFGLKETFYNWEADSVEVAHFDYSPAKSPINLLVVDLNGDGKPVSSDVAAILGHTRETYRWQGTLIHEVDVEHGERASGHLAPLRPLHKARPHYDERGDVQRVELVWPAAPPRTEATVELMFERRGSKIFRPRP